MTELHFIKAILKEDHALADPRRPDASAPAAIRLGQYEDGQWAASTSGMLSNGSGHGGPLGHWSDCRRISYATRDEAFEAARSRIEAMLDAAPDTIAIEVKRIRDWLRTLQIQQGDLFAAFA